MENAEKEYEKDEAACDEAPQEKVDAQVVHIEKRRLLWVRDVVSAEFRLMG